MKNVMKKSIAVFLLIAMLSSFFVSFAASEKKYYDYGSYVLLGDSVASGWSDIEHRDTSFKRVEGSYGALIADELGVKYHPMAGLAFRTVEIRYMLEDDFEGDEFLFYSVDEALAESMVQPMRKAISEAGLITLNVGGNDWGSYVGWHVERAMAEMEGTENFVEQAREYLERTDVFGLETIETLIGIADLAGCLPELVKVLPLALNKGYENYMANWDIMIQDIYALNPDVTLVVIGMFDTALQDESMKDYVSDDSIDIANIQVSGEVGQFIVDFANLTMRQGAEKYGYTFINPIGTLCEKKHPSYAGHRTIADYVLKALPDANFPYTDVDASHKNYAGVDYMYQNDYMAGISETTFGVDKAMTQKDLYDVIYNIWGLETEATNETAEVTRSKVVSAAFKAVVTEGGFDAIEFLAAFSLTIKEIFADGISSLTKSATRGEAATILAKYAQL